jgi:gamma-glutamyltranspeptidase/glutathione hydrolase
MGESAIAAGHESTLESAEEILRLGGNAFDAAISACFTMFAAEPCMASAGAGGFAMCHSVKDGTQLLDFFTQTPKRKELDRSLDFKAIPVDFGEELETFHVGNASIATPGVIAGIAALHERYGTMPMKELVQHAKQISRVGVKVNAFGELDMGLLKEIFAMEPSVRDIFFKDGQVKKQGEYMAYPHLSDFLDFIVDEGERGFYEGEMGASLCKSIYEGGGFLTREDFTSYKALWSEPMRMPYRDMVLCLPNGPGMGGAIMALLDHHGMTEDWSLTKLLLKVKEEIHEAGGISKAMDEFLPSLGYRPQGTGEASKGTSHLSILDQWGNSIALTISIGEGSGIWIPGTDMQMNNMLGETFLLPGGHHSWAVDSRLNSMMTPVMVLDVKNKVRYAGGSGGAGRIPYVIYQVLEALFEKGLNLEEATLYPRQHWHEGELHYENGSDIEDLKLGKTHRCWNEHSLFFGGVHSVFSSVNGDIQACGDPRRYGVSKVF